jgi:hypothetical protein
MPYYERTGMISHRHPFYGYGENPFSTEQGYQPGPWVLQEEQPDAGSPLPAPPIPAKAGIPLVPLLILGGAVAIFVLTLRKRG